jgi:hypothetical protein
MKIDQKDGEKERVKFRKPYTLEVITIPHRIY